jgi:hypothetical protein
MHYAIIAIIIVLIVIWQVSTFAKTIGKLRIFKSIFSDSNNQDYKLQSEAKVEEIEAASDAQLDAMLEDASFNVQTYHYTQFHIENGETPCFRREAAKSDLKAAYGTVSGFFSQNSNPIYTEIENAINNYLSANKSGVSDFHLMKDIVDRNCDAQEEEINTQVPIPLYFGLVGTMVGILVGIGYLWVSDGLRSLLDPDSSANATSGVEALLGGVALAMISSILGILLTTFGSIKAKKAKAKVEKNKHAFLSWIQARLLPNLSSGTAQALEKMSQNLGAFNSTFSANTSELGKALSQVNESYRLQVQLLDAVKQIADKDVSTKNIQLYKALKNSTEEIGVLATYLNNVNEYLANVKALNEKLDTSEQRAKTVEEMAVFFKAEVQQIEARKGAINKAVGTVDDTLQATLSQLKDHAEVQLEELKKSTSKQYDFLQENRNELRVIVAELKNLSAVKESISKFEQATRAQTGKLDSLATTIRILAEAKAEGAAPKFKKSITKKILIWTSSVIGGLLLPLLLLLLIANWHYISKFLNGIIGLLRI